MKIVLSGTVAVVPHLQVHLQPLVVDLGLEGDEVELLRHNEGSLGMEGGQRSDAITMATVP